MKSFADFLKSLVEAKIVLSLVLNKEGLFIAHCKDGQFLAPTEIFSCCPFLVTLEPSLSFESNPRMSKRLSSAQTL